jgi:hypothetical protein
LASRHLGTSRAPLRESLWRLRGAGLVTGSGRDTRTVALTADDIRELHLLRTTLEALLYQNSVRDTMLLGSANGTPERRRCRRRDRLDQAAIGNVGGFVGLITEVPVVPVLHFSCSLSSSLLVLALLARHVTGLEVPQEEAFERALRPEEP